MKKQKDDMQVNVAGLRRNIKNLAHNYSDAQVKVREATSNDPWGPSATIMAEVADLTYNVVAFSEIMQMIWKRLNDHGKNWRHVYKALILLEYLIKTGTEKVAQQCKENIFAIQTLREFVYFEENKDQGTHVREKAKQLVNLLKDDERLKNERVKALKAKERFAQHPSGFGSDGYIDGPSQRDMPPGWQEEPKPASELEMVRPQTAGEEELQLQLAMAMSREEAEQEEAKRRSDDVRLQLALSQSEQDFKQQTTKKEEPQSHLLDLLEISLGATSISSPPLGAAGGVGTDPWGTPARAASQLSDPWSGTSSPQIDPWQPAALRSQTASAPLGAVGGIGSASNGEAWALRTQSPSVASGSSTEGWLHSNGAATNGNISAAQPTDPWLITKTIAAPLAAPRTAKVEPWLMDSAKPVLPVAAILPADPWAPKTAASNDDPWGKIESAGAKIKPSPDMDEFDIITNRNKTGDFLMNDILIGSNNNNASLIDDMDPLSATNSYTAAAAAGLTNTKRPLKTPQAFLGENSSLVNLDNLIKPVVPQTQSGNAAYNPFSDTVIPPKTNLFQQQQPAVPSINQLKQQQPFTMSVNQDPWAPVSNTNVNTQLSKDYLIDYEMPATIASNECNMRQTTNLTLKQQQQQQSNNSNSNSKNNYNNNNLAYSKSDYSIFYDTEPQIDYYNFNNKNNSNSIDNIRNMQISSDNFETTTFNYNFPTRLPNNQNNNSNNNFVNTTTTTTPPAVPPAVPPRAVVETSATAYSNALSAALASTPGITIAPLNALECDNVVGGSLFNYGFYDANSTNSTSYAMAPCKFENNNVNNNMPWIKPEAAASNPFLS